MRNFSSSSVIELTSKKNFSFRETFEELSRITKLTDEFENSSKFEGISKKKVSSFENMIKI